MPSLRHTFLSALLLASAGCGDFLSVEVEQPSLCKTVAGQTFGGAQYSTTLDINVGQELQGLGFQSPKGVDLFLSLKRAKLIAKAGITNFDFIDVARINVQSTVADGPPPVEVLSYTRTGPTGAEVELTDDRSVNISQYITQSTLRVEAALTGRLPPQDWTLDIEVCLYGRAKVRYVEALQP